MRKLVKLKEGSTDNQERGDDVAGVLSGGTRTGHKSCLGLSCSDLSLQVGHTHLRAQSAENRLERKIVF